MGTRRSVIRTDQVAAGDPELAGLPDRCPPDASHLADLYVMDRLTPDQASLFEQHYLICDVCAREAALAADFAAAVRPALTRRESIAP